MLNLKLKSIKRERGLQQDKKRKQELGLLSKRNKTLYEKEITKEISRQLL